MLLIIFIILQVTSLTMDIPATKSELRQIITDAIDERLTPIKEELTSINNINRDLKLQYLNTIGRVLEREALETIDNFSCSYHQSTGITCKSLLREQITKYTEALSFGDLASAFTILNAFDKMAKRNAGDKDKVLSCNKDWEAISRILKRHREIAKDISALFSAREIPSDIGELDFSPEELYNEVIFPFSHPLRIQILHTLKTGSKRFTSLKNELNVKNTGLLVHHLKPLTDSNLVFQDHRKQYALSDKGFTIIRHFAQLAAAMHPETPITISMQPLVILQDKD